MPFEDYTPKQKKLAMIAEPRDKITAADLKKLRKGKILRLFYDCFTTTPRPTAHVKPLNRKSRKENNRDCFGGCSI